MRQRLAWLIPFVLVCAGCAAPPPARPREPSFHTLLGPGQETDWKHIGDGGFKIENGIATSHGGRGVLVYRKRTFRNFVLGLKFKQNKADADSGVFVRFPDPGKNATAPATMGYQIEIYKVINGSNQGMGAIDNFAKPIDDVPVRPVGEWNTLEISCIGQEYRVKLNGRQVTVFKGDRAPRGYIGLQNHDPESIVQFRNVWVLDLHQ